MNKKLLITLLPILAITACNKSAYTLEFKVATPSGSPATAFYKYLTDTQHLEVNTANNVLAYLSSKNPNTEKDIVITPTNYGIAQINAGADFKIAATLTFGNFYLLSTGVDTDSTLNEGDSVLAFQQNGVAGKLFNYVYGDKNLEVTYVEDGTAVITEITQKSGLEKYGYILLAQPAVNNMLKKYSQLKVAHNLQDDFKTKSGGKEITQASIFVRNGLDEKAVKKFLSAIESDVKDLLNDPEKTINKYDKNVEDEIFTGKIQTSKEATINLLKNNNQIGLGFKYAYENKASIDTFVGCFGMPTTNEEIYFRVDK